MWEGGGLRDMLGNDMGGRMRGKRYGGKETSCRTHPSRKLFGHQVVWFGQVRAFLQRTREERRSRTRGVLKTYQMRGVLNHFGGEGAHISQNPILKSSCLSLLQQKFVVNHV